MTRFSTPHFLFAPLLALCLLPAACDGEDLGDEDLAAQEHDEALLADGDDDFRLFCPVFPGSAPSADVSDSLAGAPQSVTEVGEGTGGGCDRFTLGVATPSGHRAHEVTFEGDYIANGVDTVVGVWARSCTTVGLPICTTWANIPVEVVEDVDCYQIVINVPPEAVSICETSIDGVATLPANNSYTEVRAGIRVENGGGSSLPATITVSE